MKIISRFVVAVCSNTVKKFIHHRPPQIISNPPKIQLLNPSFSEKRQLPLQSRLLCTRPGYDPDDRSEEYEPDNDDVNEPYLKMLDDLRHKRDPFKAAENFEIWRNEGFKPNLRVFERLLTALVGEGKKKDFKSAHKYLNEMADKFPFDQSRVQGQFIYVLNYCYEENKQGMVKKIWADAKERNFDVDAMAKQLGLE